MAEVIETLDFMSPARILAIYLRGRPVAIDLLVAQHLM